MKYTVTVQGQTFDVEVGDVTARPVIATIGATTFEVWPETPKNTLANTPQASEVRRATPPPTEMAKPQPANLPAPSSANSVAVKAPIPGVIVAITAQVGMTVSVGEELCVLEAMKMRTPIRAARAGKIAAVYISVGQQVKHHAVLMDYEA